MKKYDLSKIMKRAHYIYRHAWHVTFSYALKKAWSEAKEEARMNAESERRSEEYRQKYGARDYRNYRSYYGSRMGHNDWVRDYRNDMATAIKRSMR